MTVAALISSWDPANPGYFRIELIKLTRVGEPIDAEELTDRHPVLSE
ncbi:hypothetical protein ACFYWX_40230 [Streptomyces sp. NPDC002888]